MARQTLLSLTAAALAATTLVSSLDVPHQTPLLSPSLSTKGRDRVIALHKSLVEIESINGNEHAVGNFLVDYLTAANFTVETQTVADLDPRHPLGARRNVYAYKGSKRATRLLLTSHMDTVPLFFPYSVRGDELRGRGSSDAKACIAAQIIALEDLLSSEGAAAESSQSTAGLADAALDQADAAGESPSVGEGDVGLLFVVGEERDGAGMKAANDLSLAWEAVVFGEPTGHKLSSGHKGALIFEVVAHGKAAHSAYPELGESAISMLVLALAAIDRLELPSSEMFGETTTNIGVVGGGVAVNVLAENASALVLSRLAAGTPETAMEIVERVVKGVDERLVVRFGHRFAPVVCDTDIDGFETEVKRGGTDIPNLKGDHKRYLYGPGSVESAHSDHEHITISDLRKGVKNYKKIIKTLLQR